MRKILLGIFLALSTPALAAEFALVDQSDSILEFRDFKEKPNDPTGKGWRWLPVEVTMPVSDATQIVEGPTITVEKGRVTRVWTARAKTADEIDAEKSTKVDSIDVAVFRALCNHENRIRALQGQATITVAQCKTAFKALIP